MKGYTLRKKDKIPYGTCVAFRGLPMLFSRSLYFHTNTGAGLLGFSYQCMIPARHLLPSRRCFMPDEFEMRKLISFVENGNDVFISANMFPSDVEDMLNCRV